MDSGTGGCWSWILQNIGVLASDIISGCFCASFEDDCLVGFFNTTYLYDRRLGGTKVMSADLNKIFLLLFVATFATVPNCHPMYT